MDKARSTRVRASCSASDTALRCDDDRNVLQRLQESYEWVIVNRHTQMQIQTPTDRQTNKQTDRQTNKQTDKQTDTQADRQTNKQTGRQTDKQTDRQTSKQTINIYLMRQTAIYCTLVLNKQSGFKCY